jgi:hypothetical protein
MFDSFLLTYTADMYSSPGQCSSVQYVHFCSSVHCEKKQEMLAGTKLEKLSAGVSGMFGGVNFTNKGC